MQQINAASHHRAAHAVSLGMFAEAFQGSQSLAKGACWTPMFVLSYICLCVRKVKQGSAILTREWCLQSPSETSPWLPCEGWGVGEGLLIVCSTCLWREALEPAGCGEGRDRRDPSLAEALPCLSQGSASAGWWDECSVEVGHQFITQAKMWSLNVILEINLTQKTHRNNLIRTTTMYDHLLNDTELTEIFSEHLICQLVCLNHLRGKN